jgi:hypothetical protein
VVKGRKTKTERAHLSAKRLHITRQARGLEDTKVRYPTIALAQRHRRLFSRKKHTWLQNTSFTALSCPLANVVTPRTRRIM